MTIQKYFFLSLDQISQFVPLRVLAKAFYGSLAQYTFNWHHVL
jgi:hypothetical protein